MRLAHLPRQGFPPTPRFFVTSRLFSHLNVFSNHFANKQRFRLFSHLNVFSNHFANKQRLPLLASAKSRALTPLTTLQQISHQMRPAHLPRQGFPIRTPLFCYFSFILLLKYAFQPSCRQVRPARTCPAGLSSHAPLFCYFSFILSPERIFQSFCQQATLAVPTSNACRCLPLMKQGFNCHTPLFRISFHTSNFTHTYPANNILHKQIYRQTPPGVCPARAS